MSLFTASLTFPFNITMRTRTVISVIISNKDNNNDKKIQLTTSTTTLAMMMMDSFCVVVGAYADTFLVV